MGANRLFAAQRRPALIALQLDDIERRAGGVLIHLGHSKNDQKGKGTDLSVPNGKKLRPVDALDAWLAAAAITSGPVFREVDRHGRVGAGPLSGRSIARIVKRAIKAAGLDEAAFSGHSMRAGFITSALDAGEDPLKVNAIAGTRSSTRSRSTTAAKTISTTMPAAIPLSPQEAT